MNESVLREALENALAQRAGPTEKRGALRRAEIEKLMGWGRIKAHDTIRMLVESGAWECEMIAAKMSDGRWRKEPHYRPKVAT